MEILRFRWIIYSTAPKMVPYIYVYVLIKDSEQHVNLLSLWKVKKPFILWPLVSLHKCTDWSEPILFDRKFLVSQPSNSRLTSIMCHSNRCFIRRNHCLQQLEHDVVPWHLTCPPSSLWNNNPWVPGPEVIKLFSSSTQLRMKFVLPIKNKYSQTCVKQAPLEKPKMVA